VSAPAPARDLLAAAAELAAELRADAAAREAARELPFAAVRRLAQSGIGAAVVPAAAGGPGLDYPTIVELVRTVSAADSSVGQVLMIHYCQLMKAYLEGYRSPLVEWMAAEAVAGRLFASASAERGTRSAADHRTRVTGSRLTGRKYYCTGSPYADWLVVQAVTDGVEGGGEGGGVPVRLVVDATARGVERIDDWNAFGQRLTGSGSVVFTDVEVDPALVMATGRAPESLHDGLFAAACANLHAAVAAGIARAAADDGVAFLREKARPWAFAGMTDARHDPHLVKIAGEIATAVAGAEALLVHSSRAIETARLAITPESALAARVAVAQAKATTSAAALHAATELFTLGGTGSCDADLNLDRHWRNARTHSTHDPTRWLMFFAGDALVNDTAPPNTGRL
jgi:alkylation response protein AidB-like acyl-CoA dehydrogenase